MVISKLPDGLEEKSSLHLRSAAPRCTGRTPLYLVSEYPASEGPSGPFLRSQGCPATPDPLSLDHTPLLPSNVLRLAGWTGRCSRGRGSAARECLCQHTGRQCHRGRPGFTPGSQPRAVLPAPTRVPGVPGPARRRGDEAARPQDAPSAGAVAESQGSGVHKGGAPAPAGVAPAGSRCGGAEGRPRPSARSCAVSPLPLAVCGRAGAQHRPRCFSSLGGAPLTRASVPAPTQVWLRVPSTVPPPQ